ncbi:MAG: hypothetical protein KKE73_05330 [Proteobacteria bacterium]|nr:hypothetical protein [Pseudomonadota bacterium]
MTLTPLETLLGSAIISIITALSVRLVLGGSFVTKVQCRLNHDQECRTNGSIQRKLDIQFRMLRALILHSDLPTEKKEEILNERGVDR